MKGLSLILIGLLTSFVSSCAHSNDDHHREHWRRQQSATSAAVASVSSLVASSTAVAIPGPSVRVAVARVDSATVKATVLVLARDQDSARQATSGLNAYGIPFQTLIVPQAGTTLPALNSSSGGNFGGFIILSGLAYDYGGSTGWRSALTDDQYNQIYAYQINFGVRMVQYDVYPQAAFGTSVIGSCCDGNVEQLVSFSNTTSFAQAGLKTGAGMSTLGLYHYATKITDPSTTWEIAQFAANSQYSSPSTAGVINNFNGREQMAWFTTWATDWSPTSNYLQHAAITWMTRGLYAGFRRVNLNTQIDDMLLNTPIYKTSSSYRVTSDDMSVIRDWVPSISSKLNPGSSFKPEVGYNGNGNLIQIDPDSSNAKCSPHPIYTLIGVDPTDLEWKKPLGTGVNRWPATPTNYTYTLDCLTQDPLSSWFQNTTNRNTFTHLSHTFTHELLNNATYDDVYKQITFNQKWFTQTSIDKGTFSSKSLIPPAITGLHNGDALKAWYDAGLRNCVGDNARSALRNAQNKLWPYITTSATDGYDGFTVIPRWPLRIYYNCDTPACTTQQWIDTANGNGDFNGLIQQEKNDMMRYYFGGYREGVMFHQANLRNQGTDSITTPDGTSVRSLYQAWVENVVQEFNRLANWPMIALKQDDLADVFTDRMARDQCAYALTWTLAARKITSVTVTAKGNTCSKTIPVTVPGSVSNTQGFKTEKVGNDPLTVWVKLSGSAVTLTLSSPVSV